MILFKQLIILYFISINMIECLKKHKTEFHAKDKMSHHNKYIIQKVRQGKVKQKVLQRTQL